MPIVLWWWWCRVFTMSQATAAGANGYTVLTAHAYCFVVMFVVLATADSLADIGYHIRPYKTSAYVLDVITFKDLLSQCACAYNHIAPTSHLFTT